MTMTRADRDLPLSRQQRGAAARLMTPRDIKEARRALGLSVSDLARLLDTDPQTVRRMEQRETANTFRRPAPRMIRLIRAYLDGYRPDDRPPARPE